MDWSENDDNAYILEVDLEYPKEIHDEQADYRRLHISTWKYEVEEKLLSKHQRELHRHYYNGKEARDEKQPKLIPNQIDKTNYVAHVKALQFYL